MQNLLKKILSLFTKKEDPHGLGAILNEPDNRDIPYPAVAGAVPETFPAQISVPGALTLIRLLQGNLGTCVEHCLEFIKRAEDGVVHSRRVPYVITRNELGWTEASGQGLPQREAAKTATIVGMPKDLGVDDNTLPHSVYTSLVITQSMRLNSNLYKFGGFSFPIKTVNGIKQSLQNGKIVAATIGIDWGKIDADGTVHPPVNFAGYHEVAIFASDDTTGKFRMANWWGYDLYIKYEELEHVLFDAINFVDLPDDLVKRAKQMQFIFTTNMSTGAKNSTVGQLQKRLTAYGVYTGAIDNDYGLKTIQAVKDYQKFQGLAVDGKVGPVTRETLNADAGNTNLVKSKLDLWCEAAISMEGANPENCNPGNLRYVGQKEAIGKTPNGFCIFPTYAVGYSMLRDLFTRAATGASGNYKADETLYEFYAGIPMPNRYGRVIAGYAPASDNNQPNHYAEVVAAHIGVDPNVKISSLLS